MGVLQRIVAAVRGRSSQRSFAGGAVTRLTASWTASGSAINADLDGSLVLMRNRARDLTQNYEFAKRFVTLVGTHVIGPFGPTLQVRATMSNGTALDKAANDAVEVHWKRWGDSADVTGAMTLAEFQRVACKAVARDGETLVRIIRDKSLPYGIGLQLLEADRLDEKKNGIFANGTVVRQGVELNAYGRPVAYYVLADHPGENHIQMRRSGVSERVRAEDVLHIFVTERAEQVRGYTWLHAVLSSTQMLRGYQEAAVVAARVGASKMGFFKRAEGDLAQVADGEDTQTGELFQSVEPGVFGELPPGMDFVPFDPDYPHQNFEPFVKAILKQIASGLDVDYPTLGGDLAEVNYSSMRAGALETRDQWTTLQEWWIRRFCKPVYEEWLASAFLRGEVTLLESGKALPAERMTKFRDAARFQGRRWAWVDPQKDAEASKLLIAEGLASRTEIAASQGRDFDDVLAELAAEAAAMKAAGLIQEPPKQAAPATNGSASGASSEPGRVINSLNSHIGRLVARLDDQSCQLASISQAVSSENSVSSQLASVVRQLATSIGERGASAAQNVNIAASLSVQGTTPAADAPRTSLDGSACSSTGSGSDSGDLSSNRSPEPAAQPAPTGDASATAGAPSMSEGTACKPEPPEAVDAGAEPSPQRSAPSPSERTNSADGTALSSSSDSPDSERLDTVANPSGDAAVTAGLTRPSSGEASAAA